MSWQRCMYVTLSSDRYNAVATTLKLWNWEQAAFDWTNQHVPFASLRWNYYSQVKNTHILRMDIYFEERLPLGAWLVKWIWLLSMSCFIVFPLHSIEWFGIGGAINKGKNCDRSCRGVGSIRGASFRKKSFQKIFQKFRLIWTDFEHPPFELGEQIVWVIKPRTPYVRPPVERNNPHRNRYLYSLNISFRVWGKRVFSEILEVRIWFDPFEKSYRPKYASYRNSGPHVKH